MTYQEDREKTTFISPLPILTSPYLDYPELIDYIQDFETLGRKKHLLFINDADGKAEDLALDMAFQIDGKYPYKGEGRQPKIPQVMTGLKAVGGKPMVTMEDAYKKFHFIGRCIVLFDIRHESYDSLKVSFPCLSKTEIVVFAFLKPGDDLNSLPPAFLHYCKIFDLRKRQFVERVCMERSKDTASEPQTPAGATVNPTGQAMPEARNTASRLLEEPCNFNWETKEGKVYSNGTEVVSLTPLQLKLFLALYKKGEKFVSSETLKACWDTKPGYGSFLTDAMSGLECSLRTFLGVKKDIFEKQKDRKKIVAYKLPL